MDIPKTKPYNMEPNIEAALTYFVTPLSGVFVYLMEKENKFVRFHAMQSILFGLTAILAMYLAKISVALLIGIILDPLVSMIIATYWVILMWKAYNSKEYKLPVIGKIARDQIYGKTW